MRQTALIYLHVTARLQLIHYFKPPTSYDLNFNTPFQIPSILGAVKYKFYDLLINLEDNGIMCSCLLPETQRLLISKESKICN